MKFQCATVAVLASTAVAQFNPGDSVAEYIVTPSASVVDVGDIITFSITGQAIQNQIGNNSGIGGVNLTTEVSGGLIAQSTIMGNDEDFGAFNILFDGPDRFSSSQANNSFVGNNYSVGITLFSFSVITTEVGTIDVALSQGFVSTFFAAQGLVGPFQVSVPYDAVAFGTTSVQVVPAPGAAGILGAAGLALARRRR